MEGTSKETKKSHCRQNYAVESEAAINKQLNSELYASYVYLSIAWYFDRDDVALKGFHEYFRKLSGEKRCNSDKLMDFQNKRGGRVVLQDVKRPAFDDWTNSLNALKVGLELEKQLNQSYMDLHKVSCQKGDAHLEDFIEDAFLNHQVETMKTLSDYITTMKHTGGPGTLGEYMFDKEDLSC